MAVIDVATGTVKNRIPVGSGAESIAISPNGTLVYVANGLSNSVSVINTGTGKVTSTVSVSPNPGGVAFSKDGTKAYVTAYGSTYVAIIDVATGKVTKLTVGDAPSAVAVN